MASVQPFRSGLVFPGQLSNDDIVFGANLVKRVQVQEERLLLLY